MFKHVDNHSRTTRRLVAVMLLGLATLGVTACGSAEDRGPAIHIVGGVDCTGSVNKVGGGFMAPARAAVKLAGATPGSKIRLDVISANTQADTGWIVDHSVELDETLVTDELMTLEMARTAKRAAKRVVPDLVRACRNRARARGGSDVLGAAIVASRELSATISPERIPIFLMSTDGRHHVPGDWLDLRNPVADVVPAQVVRRLEAEGRLPKFPEGTRVVAVGLGRGDTVDSREAARIEAVWRGIFKASGARIEYFGPRFPGLELGVGKRPGSTGDLDAREEV